MTFTTTDFGFLLSLEPGDEIVSCLIQFARRHELDAALVTGIGSVTEIELGTGGGRDRDHRRSLMSEPLELCSLTGTVTLLDGEPFPHLHGTFARIDHSVVGGHVYLAVAGASLDIGLQVAERPALRAVHHGTATNRNPE